MSPLGNVVDDLLRRDEQVKQLERSLAAAHEALDARTLQLAAHRRLLARCAVVISSDIRRLEATPGTGAVVCANQLRRLLADMGRLDARE